MFLKIHQVSYNFFFTEYHENWLIDIRKIAFLMFENANFEQKLKKWSPWQPLFVVENFKFFISIIKQLTDINMNKI